MFDHVRSSGATDVSTTAHDIREFRKVNDPEEVFCEVGASDIDKVLLVDQRILVQLEPFQLATIKLTPKMQLGMSTLRERCGVKKSSFFKSVWGEQKYASHLHDNLIYNLLSQMKKVVQSDLTIENGHISPKGLLVL